MQYAYQYVHICKLYIYIYTYEKMYSTHNFNFILYCIFITVNKYLIGFTLRREKEGCSSLSSEGRKRATGNSRNEPWTTDPGPKTNPKGKKNEGLRIKRSRTKVSKTRGKKTRIKFQ